MPPHMSGLHATPVAPEERACPRRTVAIGARWHLRRAATAKNRGDDREDHGGCSIRIGTLSERGKETSVYVIQRGQASTGGGRRTSGDHFLVVHTFPVTTCAYIATNARQLTARSSQQQARKAGASSRR